MLEKSSVEAIYIDGWWRHMERYKRFAYGIYFLEKAYDKVTREVMLGLGVETNSL